MILKNLSHIEINIENNLYYGFDQDWHTGYFHKMAGCGPTTATMLLNYLRLRDSLNIPINHNNLDELKKSLNNVFNYVTPGAHGVNKTSMFVDGINKFILEHKLNYKCEELVINKGFDKRPNLDEAIDFIKKGIDCDCPIAFLSLSKGDIKVIDSWHWMTIVSIVDKIVTFYDNGKKESFDIEVWLKTSKLGGGFVYLIKE